MMFHRAFKTSLILSILLHLSLTLIMLIKEFRTPVKKEIIEISLLEPEAMDNLAKQIVQQNDKPVNDEVDPHAKFLSQFNQRVVRETKSPLHGDFKNQNSLKESRENNERSKEKASKLKQAFRPNRKTLNGLPIMQALSPTFDWEKADKSGGSKRETASKTDDYLKNVEVGAQTMLSTREFLYYTYYNRIRSQLKQYWEPKIKEKVKKIFSQGRSIASDADKVTKVLIVLNQAGTLVNVQVVGESGVRDLDEAAIEAFRQAAPFPNPPQGIIDQEGLIKIRWDFILEA